jgi:tetratricopeptide (TPR) repeat protein
MQAAEELVRQFCEDLRVMWRQAGGPSLRALSKRVGRSKSQVGAILGGQVRRPPDWEVVRELITAFLQHATDRDRARNVALRGGIDEYWRPRHALLEHASRVHQPAGADASAAAPVAPPRPVPRQLPPAVRCFTGRRAELKELASLLDQPAEGAGEVVICSISGMAGAGKTALAVYWAHRVADRFRDGQLYVNLRGYHPERPMSAGEALAGFLNALGVPDDEVPHDTLGRSARYRTELAGRQMVVVLDNASSVDQVRPLLPGTGRSLALVTSRDSLAGLVAVDGAQRVVLDQLPHADAAALLCRLIGDRARQDPEAVDVLARHCVWLPLALRLCAELAVSRPATPLCDLVGELADGQRRLELLNASGDPHAAVNAVFSWSVRHLPKDAARAFRLLGLHPGPESDAYGLAALAGTDSVTAERILDLLARAHLVQPSAITGRYGMHDLLRAYATGLTLAQDGDAERKAALDRVFDYYLGATAAAMDRLYPAEAAERPRVRAPCTPLPDMAEAQSARRWLDIERPTLAAVVEHTAAHGWAGHAIGLSITLFRYLDRGHFADAHAIYTCARSAAERAGDVTGQAHAWRGLGNTEYRLGRYESAEHNLRRALALFRSEPGDSTGEARALNGLGLILMDVGRYGCAADHFEQALAIFRRSGNRAGETMSLNNLGLVERLMGRYESAAGHYTTALEIARQTGDRTGLGMALDGLGQAERQQGRYQAAADHHAEALVLARQLGHRHGEANVLDNLGAVLVLLGRPQEARVKLEKALALFCEFGDHTGRASVLNGLGEAALAEHDRAAALRHFTAALAVATAIGKAHEQARAHEGIGRTRGRIG